MKNSRSVADGITASSLLRSSRGPVLHYDQRSGKVSTASADRVRDTALAAPTLLLPSIHVNIRVSRVPRPESNGVSCLKIPLRHA